jgi:osmotically-inducible protein OsmY
MNRTTTSLCVGSACAGALGMFLLDPSAGRRRRHQLRDRTLGRTRRLWRSERVLAQRTVGRTRGLLHRERRRDYDDVTLAHKVETQLFRDRDVPKGQLNVDAHDGVVTLRGAVEGELIASIVERTRRVKGVRGVDNLLHPPGTIPPNLDGLPAELIVS